MEKTAHPLTMAMVLLTALLLGGGPARAQEKPIPGSGALDAIGPGGKPLGACALRHTDVAVEISGFVARVTVTQLFASRFTEPVEAIYTFPLSDRAAVDAMSMRTGERTIRGEIKRREEARRLYEAARAAGQVAALLDQERPNIFTQTLANLMPGATVEIRIEYVEPLLFRDGTFEFSFPTVVGPRFIPGAPTGHAGTGWAPDTTRVPDASRITPPVTPEGTRAGHDIAIAVDIDAGVPILDVVSPLHAIDVERPEANQARVRLRDQADIPNRDFVRRYAVAGDEVRSGYLAHRDGEGEGYVTFVLLPPKRVTSESAAPKEMIFVIDRSGSQAGLPLEKAKETMRWILDHMNPNDTFQVVDFGNTANVLFPTPQPASPEMKRQARAHIAAPALTDVRLEFRGLDVTDVFPTAPSDVWDRRPLIVHARYRRAGEGQVVLSGFRQGKPYKQVIDVTLPERATGNGAIASMWARAKVDDLMWQDLAGLQSGTFPEPLREQIVQTALGHRLMTQFTSFVAVEDRVVNEGGTQRTVSVPVEMPQGVRYDGIFGGAAANAAEGRLYAAPVPMFAQRAGVAPESLTLQRSFAAYDRDASAEKAERRPVSVRLAPELQALVEGAPSPGRPVRVIDGRVQVKVLLRSTHARTIHRLEAAGLRLNQVAARYVVGSIEVTRLAALAELDGVERVELP